MDETESRDPITNVPIDQEEPEIYLPGTPTVEFTAYLERFIAMLRR
ncbi:hypothetical protein ACLI4U_00980 [Natrialbaceae archaeon A-CW2]|nr:hypothetical protein [Natronosalvus amylolyticus]